MSSIASTGSISCCSSLSPSIDLLRAHRRLLKSRDAIRGEASITDNTICSSFTPNRLFTPLIISKPRFCSNHSCCATNFSDLEREESRWLREEHRWLREEQRWLREEVRWNAERDELLREISQLRTKIQELESERHNSTSSSVAESLLSRVTSLLQVLNLNSIHRPATVAGGGDGNGVIGYGGASVKPMMFYENEDIEEKAFMEVVDEPKTKKEIERRRALRVGCEGEDVRLMQEALQSFGFYSGEEDIEYSSFSIGTEQAVKAWQASLGAREDGIMTVELLDRLYASKQDESYKEDFIPKMPRGASSSGASIPSNAGAHTSTDVAWNFAEAVDGNKQRVKCNFCGKVMNGGITRLKEHLAHVKGNVSKCSKVSTEVRESMRQLLLQMKQNKKDKQRRDHLLEDEIIKMRPVEEDEVVEQEEELLERTLRRSRDEAELEYEQNTYMVDHRETYHAGGGSRQPPRPLSRSSSQHVGGSSGYGYGPYSSTPQERLAQMEISLEREKYHKKQNKIDSASKKFKALKAKMRNSWGQWFTHNKVQFSAIESPYTKPLMHTIRECGEHVPPPTAYDIAEVFLKEESQSLKKWINSLKPQWKEWGVTIMCDGWTGPTKMSIINFLVYSNNWTVFHASVDATDVPSKDANYYYALMKKMVMEVGPEFVVQVVTDNEAAIKAGGKKLMEEFPHLYWTGCAAHCLDLILADLSKKSNIHKVLEKAQSITQFIYRYDKVVNIMLKFTNGRQLLRPGITRFATNFIALESIVKHKKDLRNMWESDLWMNSKYGNLCDENATRVRDLILEASTEARQFWKKAAEVLKVQEPLVKVLRLVDGDEKPTMGFLYEAMDRAKLAIQKNCRYYQTYWNIIDNRWNFQLHHDLHAAGYFLNPQFAYDGIHNPSNDQEVMRGVRNVIQRLEPEIDKQILAINEMEIYTLKREDFSSNLAQRAILYTNPAQWWKNYGNSTPHLRKIAMRVLSATTSASNCERNWSTFSLMHTKSRNRLKYRRLNLLVFVHYNMKLKLRAYRRTAQEDLQKSYNPINLDYIFQEDDPLNPWLEEREDPVLDRRDPNTYRTSSWEGLDDDDDDTNEVPSGEVPRHIPSQATNEDDALSEPSDNDDDDGGGGNGSDDGGGNIGGGERETHGYGNMGSHSPSNVYTYQRSHSHGDRRGRGRSNYPSSSQRIEECDHGSYMHQPFNAPPQMYGGGGYDGYFANMFFGSSRSTSIDSRNDGQGQPPRHSYAGHQSSSSYEPPRHSYAGHQYSSDQESYGFFRMPVQPQNPYPEYQSYYQAGLHPPSEEYPSQSTSTPQDFSSSSSNYYPNEIHNFGTLNIGNVYNEYNTNYYQPDSSQQEEDSHYENPPRRSFWW